MKFAKTLIWTNSGLFLMFGLGFAFVPKVLAAVITGAAPPTSSAVIDMRATYGGMALGLALIFGLCARTEGYVQVGVQGVLAVMATLASARVLGILLDGGANRFMLMLLAAEVVMAIMARCALTSLKNRRQ